MSTVSSPISIVIDRLAVGPTAPAGGAGSTPLRTRVAEVVAQMGPGPWSRRIIADERNLVTLIASRPAAGTGRTGIASSTSGGWCWAGGFSGS